MIFKKLASKEWNDMYKLAKKYYNYHHHLLVPKTFKTTNGYEFNKEGKNLGIWVDYQKKASKYP